MVQLIRSCAVLFNRNDTGYTDMALNANKNFETIHNINYTNSILKWVFTGIRNGNGHEVHTIVAIFSPTRWLLWKNKLHHRIKWKFIVGKKLTFEDEENPIVIAYRSVSTVFFVVLLHSTCETYIYDEKNGQ